MGFALLYQGFSVVTALYFRKRLATAYAIGRSGMGLTFALAPFTQLLLDQYAWQGEQKWAFKCKAVSISDVCLSLLYAVQHTQFIQVCSGSYRNAIDVTDNRYNR